VEKEPVVVVGTGDGRGTDRGVNRGRRNVCRRKEVVGSGTNRGVRRAEISGEKLAGRCQREALADGGQIKLCLRKGGGFALDLAAGIEDR